MSLRIGIVGTGRVGSTLGRRWAGLGHRIVFGARDPGDPEVLALAESLDGRGSVRSVAGLGDTADVVVLAVPGSVAAAVAAELGELGGRVLVDCTNPVAPGGDGLVEAGGESGAERVARAAPTARVVKAFNTTGSGNMADAGYPGGRVMMPICGDDPAARDLVAGLAAELGFEAVVCGALRSARYLEPLAMLWITLAYREGLGPDMAFGLLRR